MCESWFASVTCEGEGQRRGAESLGKGTRCR